MTPARLHILQHALGLDQYGQGTWYRNHYVCGPGHHGYDDCQALVADGFMTERRSISWIGGDSCFVVTDAGKEAVKRESPEAPKLTRSQKRYREWLRIRDVCGLIFGQWLKERQA
jgi:hypothetical protein